MLRSQDVPSNNALECIQYFCRSQNHQSFQRLAYTQVRTWTWRAGVGAVFAQKPVRCLTKASYVRHICLQGIAAAAAGSTVEYGDCVEVLLPLVQQLARDHEAEIRSTAVKQLAGLGEHIQSLISRN